MSIRLLVLVLLAYSFALHAETDFCDSLKGKIYEIDELKKNSNFKQVISLSKKLESTYAKCQKLHPVKFHRLFYITLSVAKKLNLDEKNYNKTLSNIRSNLQFIKGDYSLREYEVHLQEIDFLILKKKLDLALSKILNVLMKYEKNTLVKSHLFKAQAQKTRVYLYKNELNKAIESSLIAIASIKKYAPDKYAHLGWYYSNLGVANYLSGDFESAQIHFLATEKEWLKIHKPEHADFANLYTNLGSVVNMLPGDNGEESVMFHKKALVIYQKHYPKSHHRVLTAISNIAGTYKQLGNEDKSGEYYEKYALSYDFEKSNFTELGRHGDYITYLIKKGRLQEAIAWYKKIEDIIEQENYTYIPLFDGMDSFLEFYTGKENLNLALEWANLRLEKTLEFVRTISDDDKRLSHFFKETVQREYLIILTDLHLKIQEHEDKRLLTESSDTLLQALNVFNKNKTKKNLSLQFEFNKGEDSKGKAQLLSQKSRLIHSASQAVVSAKQLELLTSDIAKINNELKSLDSNFTANGHGYSLFSTKDFQKLINNNQSIVYFIQSKYHINAIVIDQDSMTVIDIQDVEEGVFERKIEEFSASVQQSNVDYTFQLKEFNIKKAIELYKHLITPLALKQNVIFVQTPLTEKLPLAALVKKNLDTENKNIVYLAQEHQIRFIPSLLSLYRERSKNPELLASIAFGAPSLNNRNANNRLAPKIILSDKRHSNINIIKMLPSLPYTNEEIASFSKLLKNNRTYIQDQATESEVRKQINNNNYIISFATHALSVEYPSGKILSALVLTPEPETSNVDEGLLTTEDIESMEVNAELVILSACNTAFSENGSVNDLSGLASSFIFAGTKNVLVSTAQISDVATAKLMTEFYANISDGFGKALMKGMSSMINSEEYSHPYYWANFRLVGVE